MIICSKCGQENRPGTFACDNCAWLLEEGTETIQVPKEQIQEITAAYLGNQVNVESSYLSPQSIRLLIESTRVSITLLPNNKGYLIGRHNSTNSFHSIDMSPHDGAELGISRRHAVIYQSNEQWYVEDLGSTNGTRINEHRLSRHEPCIIEDGDHIQFGLLIAHIQIG